MRYTLNLVIYLLIISLSALNTAHSAEITLDPVHISGKSNVHGILIEGEIVKGDYDKFYDLIENSIGGREIVFLASKGGDLLESLKIGRLIRELNITTNAPFYVPDISPPPFPFLLARARKENLVCASSCFFILAAGVNRSGGIIGIHRPYLSKEEYLDIDEKAALKISAEINKIIKEYLEEMNIPNSLVDKMYKVSGDRIEWLEYEKSGFVPYFNGVIPQLEDWVRARCPSDKKDKTWEYKQLVCFSNVILKSSCELWFKKFSPDTLLENRKCEWNN